MSTPSSSAESVIMTAINTLGSVPDDGNFPTLVATRVAEITSVLAEDSDASKVYAGLTGTNPGSETKKIHGWLKAVNREERTNRALLTLVTKPNPEYNPEGRDTARTERLESEYARNLANKARTLIGHDVTVHLEIQKFTDRSSGQSKKSRIVWAITDRGAKPEPTFS